VIAADLVAFCGDSELPIGGFEDDPCCNVERFERGSRVWILLFDMDLGVRASGVAEVSDNLSKSHVGFGAGAVLAVLRGFCCFSCERGAFLGLFLLPKETRSPKASFLLFIAGWLCDCLANRLRLLKLDHNLSKAQIIIN
jgi:hypothetical protein